MHGHYWLSGQVGAVAKERWGVPLVQSMHTLGKVKNAALAAGDAAEPAARIRGEAEVIATADRLVANTADEARQLIKLYDADPARVSAVNPGVDLSVFRPGSRQQARRRLGLPGDAVVLVFAGRVQPLKAPDIVLRAAAKLVRDHPALADRLMVAFVGGPSGTGRDDPDGLLDWPPARHLRTVRLEPPCPQPELADWYRAATLVVVPSYSESFGLVAVEAQACGTPVVAASVGGLRTAVRDGVSGVLIDSHDPASYARAIGDLLASPPRWPGSRAEPGARVGLRLGRTVDQLLRCTGRDERGGPRSKRDDGRHRPAGRAARSGRTAIAALHSLGLAFESPQPGAFLVRLEGQHKLVTMTWLIAETHSLHVEAFFCRQPDENHAEFYRFLLERGGRMFGIHFALDQVGDVYLVGRLPLAHQHR